MVIVVKTGIQSSIRVEDKHFQAVIDSHLCGKDKTGAFFKGLNKLGSRQRGKGRNFFDVVGQENA